ncbi:Txe/YoeB family toxin [Oleiphilus messinensis]|uniref:Toxin YoeB n=1 Tax=Oleiphilus messinensis TaxID=141451 RepID=A0A1Y0I9A4_9GAMM|nr:Txe/YoeB family addiction module toxin [Oleiphilus messinensis]ARU56759.1 Txe/YoeB family toxin [Oleiphilus messinensis]
MILSWAETAWEDYLYWQKIDKRMLQRINNLIKDTKRQPFEGIGDPEPLKHNWTGYWSRRINKEHRLVYKVVDGTLFIAQCRYHY